MGKSSDVLGCKSDGWTDDGWFLMSFLVALMGDAGK